MSEVVKDNRSEYLTNLECARREFIVVSSKTETVSKIDRNTLEKIYEECCIPVDDAIDDDDNWDGWWDDPEAEYADWDDDYDDRDYDNPHDEWD